MMLEYYDFNKKGEIYILLTSSFSNTLTFQFFTVSSTQVKIGYIFDNDRRGIVKNSLNLLRLYKISICSEYLRIVT